MSLYPSCAGLSCGIQTTELQDKLGPISITGREETRDEGDRSLEPGVGLRAQHLPTGHGPWSTNHQKSSPHKSMVLSKYSIDSASSRNPTSFCKALWWAGLQTAGIQRHVSKATGKSHVSKASKQPGTGRAPRGNLLRGSCISMSLPYSPTNQEALNAICRAKLARGPLLALCVGNPLGTSPPQAA